MRRIGLDRCLPQSILAVGHVQGKNPLGLMDHRECHQIAARCAVQRDVLRAQIVSSTPPAFAAELQLDCRMDS
jgi:hypothetical protein